MDGCAWSCLGFAAVLRALLTPCVAVAQFIWEIVKRALPADDIQRCEVLSSAADAQEYFRRELPAAAAQWLVQLASIPATTSAPVNSRFPPGTDLALCAELKWVGPPTEACAQEHRTCKVAKASRAAYRGQGRQVRGQAPAESRHAGDQNRGVEDGAVDVDVAQEKNNSSGDDPPNRGFLDMASDFTPGMVMVEHNGLGDGHRDQHHHEEIQQSTAGVSPSSSHDGSGSLDVLCAFPVVDAGNVEAWVGASTGTPAKDDGEAASPTASFKRDTQSPLDAEPTNRGSSVVCVDLGESSVAVCEDEEVPPREVDEAAVTPSLEPSFNVGAAGLLAVSEGAQHDMPTQPRPRPKERRGHGREGEMELSDGTGSVSGEDDSMHSEDWSSTASLGWGRFEGDTNRQSTCFDVRHLGLDLDLGFDFDFDLGWGLDSLDLDFDLGRIKEMVLLRDAGRDAEEG